MNKLVIIIPIIAVAIGVSAALTLTSDPGPDMDQMPLDPEPMSEPEPTMTASSDLDGVVNVGVLVPLTGDLTSQGEEDKIAAELAIADFNAYLAEKGATWSISGIIEDSQTNPVIALDKVTAMHAKGAKIVVGPSTSSTLRNLSGYTSANDMMMISYGSTAPSLALEGDHIFRTVPDDNNQGPAIANLMKSRGMEVLVPVWRGDTWGDGLQKATADSFEGTVGEGIRYNPEAPEFSASTSLLAEQVQGYVDEYGADKVGVLIIAFAEVTQFMQSANAHEVLSSVKWFGSDGSTNVQSLVDDSIGIEFAYATDFTTLQFAASENPITQRVTDAIVEEIGRIPTVYAYCTYDAVWLAGLAMEAAGNTNTQDAIANMLSVAEAHTGAVGSTKLNAAGDLDSTEYAVWTIRDDEWKVVGSSSDLDMMMMEPQSALDGTINVGVLVPLTGDLTSQGEEDKIAAELAIADFNEYLAEKGATWSISGIIEDSQTNPVIALDKVTAMHAKGAKIVVGPSTSSTLRNLSGYTSANDMMMISYGSTAPSLALEGDHIFRTVPDDNNQGPAIANLMKSRGMEVLVPVWRGDTWGDGLQKATADAFEGIVGEGIRYNPESPEFSASTSLLADQVQDYVDEHGADKVGVLIIAFAEVTQFMQSANAHEVLSSVKWFGSDGSTNVQSLTDDRIGLEFAYATDFTTLQFAASENPITQRVTDAIVEEIGRIPTVYAYCTYDAVWLAGLAMEAAGNANTQDVIANMLPVAEAHNGAVGSTKLNAAGDLDSTEYAVWTIRDGDWEIIGSSSDLDMMMMEPQSALEGTINIGMLFPLSGDLASHGEERRISAELGISDFNEYLAEKGATWSLSAIVEDSQTSPVIALEKVTAMHAKGAKVVVGPASSTVLRNLSGYATANDMILISYSSTAPSLAVEGDNIFRTVPDDNNQGPVISKLVASEGIEVLVPVYRGDAWGDGLYESTVNSFRSGGYTIDEGIRYNPEAPEFSASTSLLAGKVQEYVDEHGTDKVGVLVLAFAEVTLFMQSASAHDILNEIMWFGSDGSTNEQSLVEDEIGLAFAERTNFTTVQFAAADTEQKQRVTDRIMSEFGRIPNVYAYGAYDAAWLAGLAMEAAGSTDTAAVKANMIPVSENHIGAVGPLKLNAAGDLNSTSYNIWTIQEGKWTILGNAADLP